MGSPLKKYSGLFLLIVLLFQTGAGAQMAQCKAVLKGDTLTLENSKIKRCFRWNGGGLQNISLQDKRSGQVISGAATGDKGDVSFPGISGGVQKGSFRVYSIPATKISYAYVAAEVTTQAGSIELRRIFRIYADCPAIACDYYLRGKAAPWRPFASGNEGFRNIEDPNVRVNAGAITIRADKITIGGNHWRVKAVEFFDATDYNNNLVQEYTGLLYRQEKRLRGNLLLMQDQLNNAGFFMLKEAPVSTMQLQYGGFDFTAKWSEVTCAGLGLAPEDLSDSAWVSGYSIVVGVGEGERGLLQSLRSYQNTQRAYSEERDAMIVANTWGDRNQDGRIRETFILKEITAAAKLGITHLQIDDGWQTGISSNSKRKGSLTNIWREPGYWAVDTVKFPGGLTTVLEAAEKANIRLALWFNPSTDSSFANWEKDADVLIAQYKKYGIRMWKIDGVQAPDKEAEINFRKFLDKVMAATDYNALFNLDVTAGRRFGYHFMHTYGNLFLENRYTDWGNYYPHYTLRNLWQLSRYMPAQRLQVEFLNKWRNASAYAGDDALAPSAYSFDYLFAITMVAQPLAWLEVSALPEEAFGTATLIKAYKTFRTGLHKGAIFPVGEEPDGFSWTGFQSVQEGKGYLLVFRENNRQQKKRLNTMLAAGRKLRLTAVAGRGKSFSTVTGENGSILFELADPKSFALYQYTVL